RIGRGAGASSSGGVRLRRGHSRNTLPGCAPPEGGQAPGYHAPRGAAYESHAAARHAAPPDPSSARAARGPRAPCARYAGNNPLDGRATMDRRVINPWTWQDQFAFVQANEVSGAQRIVLCAGQTSVDAAGHPMHVGDMRAQLGLALDNLETVLRSAGLTLANVVR